MNRHEHVFEAHSLIHSAPLLDSTTLTPLLFGTIYTLSSAFITQPVITCHHPIFITHSLVNFRSPARMSDEGNIMEPQATTRY